MVEEFYAQGQTFIHDDGKVFIKRSNGERTPVADPLRNIFVRAVDISGLSDPFDGGFGELGCSLTTIFGKTHQIVGVIGEVARMIERTIEYNPNSMMTFELMYPQITIKEAIENDLIKIKSP